MADDARLLQGSMDEQLQSRHDDGTQGLSRHSQPSLTSQKDFDESRQLLGRGEFAIAASSKTTDSSAADGSLCAKEAVTETNQDDPSKKDSNSQVSPVVPQLEPSSHEAANASMKISSTAATASGGPEPSAGAESYEQQHVHSVYETIASHFSATRYKPWPVIQDFLLSLRPGSVGLDVGCGNGKYLGVNPNVFIMGSDRSANLVRIARDHGGERRCEVAIADGLTLPYLAGKVDFAICVAVIHHLSTKARRREAVKTLLDCVRPADEGGKILVYVWALEQSKSRRGWDEGAEQDQLVPWVMKCKGASDTAYQRYYHLYKQGELEEDVVIAGGKVFSHGYDKDNWWVIAGRGN